MHVVHLFVSSNVSHHHLLFVAHNMFAAVGWLGGWLSIYEYTIVQCPVCVQSSNDV